MIYREPIKQACERLIKDDLYLLEVGINERTLTHRLAIYIEELFPGWDIDCEYNRNWINPKRLSNDFLSEKFKSDNIDWITAFPDIIVHKRWKDAEHNLLIIEVKKEGDSRWKKWIQFDIEKLDAFMQDDEYKYQHWYFIIFNLTDKTYQLYSVDEAKSEFLNNN